jgi:small-conductance mechanosensitive channel
MGSWSLQTTDTELLDQLGALQLSDWLWAGGLVLVSLALAMLVRRALRRALSGSVTPIVARLIARIVGSVVFIVGLVYALQQVGVSVAPLLGLLGLVGLAFAFAFQEILENLIAGVFMSIRQPFTEGDEITTDGLDGIVEDVRLRAVVMRTYDGERVFVPNASVWRNPLINHTALGNRRTTIEVGVAYGSDLVAVGELLGETLLGVEGVSATPTPQALAHEFGESSINFALRFWHEPSIATEWLVRDRVMKAVKAALDDAGFEIPFPQRVVGFTNSPPERRA